MLRATVRNELPKWPDAQNLWIPGLHPNFLHQDESNTENLRFVCLNTKTNNSICLFTFYAVF